MSCFVLSLPFLFLTANQISCVILMLLSLFHSTCPIGFADIVFPFHLTLKFVDSSPVDISMSLST